MQVNYLGCPSFASKGKNLTIFVSYFGVKTSYLFEQGSHYDIYFTKICNLLLLEILTEMLYINHRGSNNFFANIRKNESSNF